MYGLIQTHKENNPLRVIASGCGIAIEYLSIFVEKYLYREVNKSSNKWTNLAQLYWKHSKI